MAPKSSRMFGLDVRTGTLSLDCFLVRTFDAITLWHVLEHVPSPRSLLGLICTLLEPDGILVLSIPSLASWEARWFGARWPHLDLPRHFYHFDPESLTKMLESTAYAVVRIDHFALRTNRSLADSLVSCTPLGSPATDWRHTWRVAWKTIGEIFLHLTMRPLAAVESAAEAGPVIMLVARPNPQS